MGELEEILGYRFKNQNLLTQALTHSSCTGDESKNYERLEFLGDRVLGVAMAHLLYVKFPQDPEGKLSPRLTHLVRKETVAEVALGLKLDHYIHAVPQELSTNENVLCDVMEAVIGAVMIDAGFETAIALVDRHFNHLIVQNSKPEKDFKTLLQEISHHLKSGNPVYELVKKEGSEHEPHFYIKVTVKGHASAVGEGKNKKLAEQNAAQKLIEMIKG